MKMSEFEFLVCHDHSQSFKRAMFTQSPVSRLSGHVPYIHIAFYVHGYSLIWAMCANLYFKLIEWKLVIFLNPSNEFLWILSLFSLFLLHHKQENNMKNCDIQRNYMPYSWWILQIEVLHENYVRIFCGLDLSCSHSLCLDPWTRVSFVCSLGCRFSCIIPSHRGMPQGLSVLCLFLFVFMTSQKWFWAPDDRQSLVALQHLPCVTYTL